MSASGEMLPSKLKWIILGCFAGLAVIMVVVYITSPKLIIDEVATVEPDQVSQLQSTASADSKPSLTAPSSAESKMSHEQASVSAVIDQTSDQPVVDPTVLAKSSDPDSPQQNIDSDQPEQRCDFSGDSQKKILGITITSKIKAFLTPMHQAYQVYVQKFAHSKRAEWYCTKNDAKQAGLTELPLDSLLKF